MNVNSNQFEEFVNHLTDLLADKVSAKLQTTNTPTAEAKEEYFNTEEAMAFLRVKSPATWKKWRSSGRIPEGKLIGGRRLYWKKSDLEKCL
jgi:predicted DNA-binding transcriptional regulator AlpA